MSRRIVAALVFAMVGIGPGFLEAALAQSEQDAPLIVSVTQAALQFAAEQPSIAPMSREVDRRGWSTPVLASLQAADANSAYLIVAHKQLQDRSFTPLTSPNTRRPFARGPSQAPGVLCTANRGA